MKISISRGLAAIPMLLTIVFCLFCPLRAEQASWQRDLAKVSTSVELATWLWHHEADPSNASMVLDCVKLLDSKAVLSIQGEGTVRVCDIAIEALELQVGVNLVPKGLWRKEEVSAIISVRIDGALHRYKISKHDEDVLVAVKSASLKWLSKYRENNPDKSKK